MASERREIDIRKYWRPVIRNTAEFQQIANAENPEFNLQLERINRMLQDVFVQTATEYGVSRWERILNIYPESGETLDDRKIRIMTMLNIRLPYTWRTLEQMLAGCVGEGNFTMSIVNDTATLTIRVKAENNSQFEMVRILLNKVVPQNLVVDLDTM